MEKTSEIFPFFNGIPADELLSAIYYVFILLFERDRHRGKIKTMYMGSYPGTITPSQRQLAQKIIETIEEREKTPISSLTEKKLSVYSRALYNATSQALLRINKILYHRMPEQRRKAGLKKRETLHRRANLIKAKTKTRALSNLRKLRATPVLTA